MVVSELVGTPDCEFVPWACWAGSCATFDPSEYEGASFSLSGEEGGLRAPGHPVHWRRPCTPPSSYTSPTCDVYRRMRRSSSGGGRTPDSGASPDLRRTGRNRETPALGELPMRTARLIVLTFLVMAAVPGSAFAQKECEDELGNTRTSYSSTATRRACSRWGRACRSAPGIPSEKKPAPAARAELQHMRPQRRFTHPR